VLLSEERSEPTRPSVPSARAETATPERPAAERRNEVTVDTPGLGPGVMITSPPNGHRLGQDEPPFVVVTGRVEDPTATTVSVLVNEQRHTARVKDGQFKLPVPVTDAQVRVTAELPARNGLPSRSSQSVIVHSSPRAGIALIALDWPADAPDVKVEVTGSWRAEPARLDAPSQPVYLSELSPDGNLPRLLYLRNVRPGAYTFVLRSATSGAPLSGRATLYLPGGGRLNERPLKPFVLDGVARRIVGRVLMPQAVLWDQTDWFSGQSESADTITKFRFPDGVSWIEKKP